MRLVAAYGLVVLIWSTTPLAIHWSNSSFSFIAAITLRMVLALATCYALLLLMRTPLVQRPGDWLVFAVGAFGLFPNMLLVYWAAQYIPSGLMSIIMGLYPFFVGFFTWAFFKEKVFTGTKLIAVLIAVGGLVVVNYGQLAVGPQAVFGVAALVVVSVLWGISSVWVKHLGQGVEPLRQGTGSLLVASPLFVITWLIIDGNIPEQVDVKSMLGVIYLVLAGSVVGHTLFFYILRKCTAMTVSLITLFSPLLAIAWGVLIEAEVLSGKTIVGGMLILLSLAIFQGVHKAPIKWCKASLLRHNLGRRTGRVR